MLLPLYRSQLQYFSRTIEGELHEAISFISNLKSSFPCLISMLLIFKNVYILIAYLFVFKCLSKAPNLLWSQCVSKDFWFLWFFSCEGRELLVIKTTRFKNSLGRIQTPLKAMRFFSVNLCDPGSCAGGRAGGRGTDLVSLKQPRNVLPKEMDTQAVKLDDSEVNFFFLKQQH